ncbi:MAG: hypothetical protein WA736_12180, partial [Candidatus Acidiferrum sp.]
MSLDLISLRIRPIIGRQFAALWPLAVVLYLFCSQQARAQEPPYLVTYSDALEEPGNLEIAVK